VIRLYRGAANQPDQDADIRVTSAVDYIVARRAIRSALISGADLHIHVTDAVIQNWFWDLEGHPDFQMFTIDPRQELEKKLGVSLPQTITVEVIGELDLLSEEAPAEPVADATQWIAAKRLDVIWSEEQPGKDHIRTLIAWLVDHDISELSSGLWIVIEEQLRLWEQQSSGTLKRLYAALRLQPAETVQFLCAWDALSSYPGNVRKTWLERLGWHTPERERLAAGLDSLPPNPTVNEAVKSLVIPYWNQRLKQRFEKVKHAGQ
jgi:hypothetical protein